MKIQTRLFLGTSVLVLGLMILQWWLYARQLRSIENDLARVATAVGEEILTAEAMFVGSPDDDAGGSVWVADGPAADEPSAPGTGAAGDHVQVMVFPAEKQADGSGSDGPHLIRRELRAEDDGTVTEEIEWSYEINAMSEGVETGPANEGSGESDATADPNGGRKVVLRVEEGDTVSERYLVVARADRDPQRIPIPVSPTVARVHRTMREGALFGGGLLVAGLVASAVLSRRLTRPLRDLAEGAEALGRGDRGVQVEVSDVGEVGDLQRSFNRMSERLTELEAERERWRQREHLAQLGDLSRGLAHTVRNPLHTLGLAVEELAGSDPDRLELVTTARGQIRRIDQWLRSFLALGAGDSVEPQETDLVELVNDVVLESVQQGAAVTVEAGGRKLSAMVVPGALRAALANLVENATRVSPTDGVVEVSIVEDAGDAVLSIMDRGPGLPAEVRERLFAPHVTTRPAGSGMGLFLARQLVVGMHGGSLEVADREGGGTLATIRLPLSGFGGDTGSRDVV